MQRASKQFDRQSKGQRGSVTLEFIIAFPVIFIATLAIAEFFFLSLVIEGGTTALQEGVRKAAEAYPAGFPFDAGGVDDDISDKVVAVINSHLNVYNVEIVDSVNIGVADDPDKQNATVEIKWNDGINPITTVTRPTLAADRLNQAGAAYACSQTGSNPAANEVTITLCFELVDANDPDGYNGPVPDWLANFGFSLNGTTFEMTTRASLE